MTTKILKAEDLGQFTGTEQWYRHPLASRVTYTDGAKYVADNGGAYWLLDEIALAQQFNRKVREQEFQVWKLQLDQGGRGAYLTVWDGDDHVVWTKRITFTDFPLPEVRFFVRDNVIMLPSEY